MNSRTYPNITPAAAQGFLRAARDAGFVTNPALVDLAYCEPFQATKSVPPFSKLVLTIQYNPNSQTCGVAIDQSPFFLPDDLVFSKIDQYIAMSQKPVAHTNHIVRKPKPGIAFHGETDLARRPREFAKLYDFPLQFTGKDVSVALIELGGGLDPADMVAYGYHKNIKEVLIDSAMTQLDGSDGAQGEVTLDCQVVGDIAPDAEIGLYFAPNTEGGFLNAITQAAKDIIDSKRAGIISISWGGPVDQFSEAGRMNVDKAIEFASKNGIITCVASGDNLADDGSDKATTDFPASSPYSFGVGGTFLEVSTDEHGVTTRRETVWNRDGAGSGGGICPDYLANPWQSSLSYYTVGLNQPASPLTNRGVPDVCAVADPASGYKCIIGGQEMVIGGTSGSAPFWAALIALLIEANGGKPLPNFIPCLYEMTGVARAAVLNDILPPGDNAVYEVTQGWDPCCGLGSPNGKGLLALFTGK